ncbi:MAG: DUF6265 family protein [Bacteroidota bacterium]
MTKIFKPANILLFLFAFFIIACKTTGLDSNQKKKQFGKMAWMEGSWEYKCPEYQMYEVWKKTNDTLFEGRSIMIIGQDTSFTEKLSITGGGINIFYNTATDNEMYNTRSSYLLISSKGKKLMFENKDNKEQSLITYQRKKAGLMIVRMEGMEEGKNVVEQYAMKKSATR